MTDQTLEQKAVELLDNIQNLAEPAMQVTLRAVQAGAIIDLIVAVIVLAGSIALAKFFLPGWWKSLQRRAVSGSAVHMTTAIEVVRAAIPDASEELVEHILWSRTPFPCGAVGARDVYRAASAWRRAGERGRELCEFCHRLAAEKFLCDRCAKALRRSETENESL